MLENVLIEWAPKFEDAKACWLILLNGPPKFEDAKACWLI
jgi:hypothetical protein